MNRKLKRYAGYGTAVLAGMLAFGFIVSLQAEDDNHKLVTMCYRHHTIDVPSYEVQFYLHLGATIGSCRTSD